MLSTKFIYKQAKFLLTKLIYKRVKPDLKIGRRGNPRNPLPRRISKC